MTITADIHDVCCAALELSQSSWLCAFSVPGGGQVSTHKLSAGNADGLIGLLSSLQAKAEKELTKKLNLVLCYEAGYDGFWLARVLNDRGIPTIVFDPASFLRPRRGRVAKTDRLDAEGMTRTLRTWLCGDHSVARAVRIPSVEEEDAKRLGRERKHLVEQRTSIVARIKGLLALHGIRITSKGIGKKLATGLDAMRTGDERPLAPFLRQEIERMLRHHAFVSNQIEEVDAVRTAVFAEDRADFPCIDKVKRLATLGGIGEISAAVLVAEVYHRSFESRRHVASFVGLAPSPYASGEVSRDRGINKAGTKLARQTLVELAWFWLRYQPNSELSQWWRDRWGAAGMRGRKVGIVALARKLSIALWRFIEQGVIPNGAVLKTA